MEQNAMGYEADIAAISGKVFYKNYSFLVGDGARTHSYETNNGVTQYEGSTGERDIIWPFSISEHAIVAVDPVMGTFGFEDVPGVFQINGTSPDGNFLFYHERPPTFYFAGSIPQYGLSLQGTQPVGPISYSTNNPIITPNPVCFARGTMIMTPRGEVAIEALSPGDTVVTASGRVAAIRWTGRRKVRCAGSPWPEAVLPVEIQAHAIAEGMPTRPTMVSPNHGIVLTCLEALIVPAHALVNGCTVVRKDVESVEYWHIELDRHDVLIANGLHAESYLDVGNRGQFEGEAGVVPLIGDGDPAEGRVGSILPTVTTGPVLSALRERLLARAEASGWGRKTRSLEPMVKADGRVLHVHRVEGALRVLVPADTAELRLQSETFVPAYLDPANTDGRRLGMRLRSIVIDDGLSVCREVDITDEMLRPGFHAPEFDQDGATRWTNGDAQLPATLWQGCCGDFFLRINFACQDLEYWSLEGSDDVVSGERAAMQFYG
jgi:hypothetical protein